MAVIFFKSSAAVDYLTTERDFFEKQPSWPFLGNPSIYHATFFPYNFKIFFFFLTPAVVLVKMFLSRNDWFNKKNALLHTSCFLTSGHFLFFGWFSALQSSLCSLVWLTIRPRRNCLKCIPKHSRIYTSLLLIPLRNNTSSILCS